MNKKEMLRQLPEAETGKCNKPLWSDKLNNWRRCDRKTYRDFRWCYDHYRESRDYNEKYYDQRKQEIFDDIGRVCYCCGLDDPDILHFEQGNPNLKNLSFAALYQKVKHGKIRYERMDYRTVCLNCSASRKKHSGTCGLHNDVVEKKETVVDAGRSNARTPKNVKLIAGQDYENARKIAKYGLHLSGFSDAANFREFFPSIAAFMSEEEITHAEQLSQ